jgi:PTS system fructose-specific IIC component
VTLPAALRAGGIVLELRGTTCEEVIQELVAAVPSGRLPPDVRLDRLVLDREQEHSTDLGVGVAVPHAHCPQLASSLVVFGRSSAGVRFSPEPSPLVHLVFLLVAPSEQPDEQLALLAQLARLAASPQARQELLNARTRADVFHVVSSPPPDSSRGGSSATSDAGT